MTDREVQIMTDSTAAAEMIEAIKAEVLAMTEVRTEAVIADRADLQKEEFCTETVETIAETAAMTDRDQIRGIDSRKKDRDRKIGMTRIGTEERIVQGPLQREKLLEVHYER